MSLWKRLFPVLLSLPLLVMTGCSKDPEAALAGIWVVSPTFTTMGAMTGAGAAPSAQAAAQGAITLGSMRMDLKEDKTFSYILQPMTMTGTWTFDNNTRLLTLNITKVDIPQADKDKGAKPMFETATWVGKFADDNTRIRVQMAPTWTEPKADLPNMADLSGGVPFIRQDSL